MINVKNFQARPLRTVSDTVAATAKNVTVECQSGRNTSIRVYNGANNVVFVEFFHTTGAPTVGDVSATVSLPIAAGATEVFQVGVSESGLIYPRFISPSGTGSIYFTPGEGS